VVAHDDPLDVLDEVRRDARGVANCAIWLSCPCGFCHG